jgi:hypothetical protein
MRHIHDEVLEAANRIASRRKDWTFTADEVVRVLPHLNERSVRTHIGSRCCVNAPKNHPHKWDYFLRVRRGFYQVRPSHRTTEPDFANSLQQRVDSIESRTGSPTALVSDHSKGLRDTLHFVVYRGEKFYVAEGLEIAAVTQGSTLDEVANNVREVAALHLEGEDAASLGLVARPRIQLLFELAPNA